MQKLPVVMYSFFNAREVLVVTCNKFVTCASCFVFQELIAMLPMIAYGVVVTMFDFHRSDRGSNPGRGGKIS